MDKVATTKPRVLETAIFYLKSIWHSGESFCSAGSKYVGSFFTALSAGNEHKKKKKAGSAERRYSQGQEEEEEEKKNKEIRKETLAQRSNYAKIRRDRHGRKKENRSSHQFQLIIPLCVPTSPPTSEHSGLGPTGYTFVSAYRCMSPS